VKVKRAVSVEDRVNVQMCIFCPAGFEKAGVAEEIDEVRG
jgi:hypothetical protein